MKKVLVAMSGGVDSSVAAALLKDSGFEVSGATMDLFGAGANTAVRDAKLVAGALSIPHYVVDAVDIFEQTVISYFVNEYRSGRTPNPCVVCNRKLKFGMLMDKARELGCDFLATGHYAVIDNQMRATGDGRHCTEGDRMLRRGADTRKDQSYFLYPILESPIDKIIFPLGGLIKDEVRSLAKKFNLPTAEKGESQDICFIPSGSYLDFLASRGIGADGGGTSGSIIDTSGNILGKHGGIHNFTVGQRKGLGALGKRMYVRSINTDDNTVVAAEDHELGSDEIVIRDIIIGKQGIDPDKKYLVQIRYRSAPTGARIIADGDTGINGINNIDGTNVINNINAPKTLRIKFDAPVRAASPGQSAVIYDVDTVAAGGTIV